MNDQIGIVAEYPFALVVTFNTGGTFAATLEPELDFVGDGLDLLRVGAIADDEKVRESGDRG